MAPTNTFLALVNIWARLSPRSTWQTVSLSALGCFSMDRILPVMTPDTSFSSFSTPSSSKPRHIMRSMNSSSVTLKST